MEGLIDIKSGKLNYSELLEKYPWIVQENQNCILSPDSDGLLCGLLMQHYFNWNIVGFYDGKVLILKDGYKPSDCIFLDMEICRDCTRSMGQHMLLWDAKKDVDKPIWKNFRNCISPNNIRLFDGKRKFPQKYPLGTIHMLLSIIANKKTVNIKKEAICPLLYTDGTFKCMFNYPENVLDWLHFLGAEDENSPLHEIFFNNSYTTSALMVALKEFFAKIHSISGSSRGGDKIKISDSNGDVVNLISSSRNLYYLNDAQVDIANKFLTLLSDLTGWQYSPAKWNFIDYNVYTFSKGMISPNGRNYDDLMAKRPISWAMTAGTRIEYTLESKYKIE